ncbi:MAG: thermonuclease family protein [Rhizobiaceae bacterium]
MATLPILVGITVWAIPRLDRLAAVDRTGAVTLADGDSLVLAGERVRLRGLDAPEFGQSCRRDGQDYACGRSARAELARLIGKSAVTCTGWERDKYNRLLARCTAGGIDLNRALVKNGWAVSYGDYAAEEADARAARRGLWAGEFDRPSAWRAVHGAAHEDEHTFAIAIWNAIREFLGRTQTEGPRAQ